MRIVVVRRITQTFFVLLALLFALVSSPVEGPLGIRGWPVNWLLDLDPLVGLATVLATGTLYAGLLWGLATVALTLVFGRVFCGWICPFGALHQFVGWLGRKGRKRAEQAALNRPARGRRLKYYLLLWMLTAAAGDLLLHGMRLSFATPSLMVLVAAVAALLLAWLTAQKLVRRWRRAALVLVPLLGLWFGFGYLSGPVGERVASLQTGLLDPIPFLFRSLHLAVLPVLDDGAGFPWGGLRAVSGAWWVGLLFLAALLANLWQPRFYCRSLCPLGALLGLLGRNALWRVRRLPKACTSCGRCEFDCEGGCQPSETLRQQDCVLCFNCREVCPDEAIVYDRHRDPAVEDRSAGVSRRGFLTAAVAGAVTTPLVRMTPPDSSLSPGVIRPPGALPEASFLGRCLKCGQCLRVCPTNVLQPAAFEAGVEGLWTPILDNRAGKGGCEPNCVACSAICPTAAIRPLSIDEKMGQGPFRAQGPLRIGTSFVDRGRCLPWAMDRPCIVCEENCPVSPKAIFLREERVRPRDGGPEIVLKRPYVDPDRCTGCGICEHVCPLAGIAAIRVSPENESRNPRRRMTVRVGPRKEQG